MCQIACTGGLSHFLPQRASSFKRSKASVQTKADGSFLPQIQWCKYLRHTNDKIFQKSY